MLECRRDGILTLAFSPDGRLLTSGGRAGSLTVWNVPNRAAMPARRCAADQRHRLVYA